jgi:hypothetical protein
MTAMTYDHDKLFSERWAAPDDPDREFGEGRITGPGQYGAAVTVVRHLKAALVAMDSTGVTTGADRRQVWRLTQSLTEKIHAYQRANNLPPAEVTP